MSETTSDEERLTTKRDRIAAIVTEGASPNDVSRAGVLALLLISDQLADISMEIAQIAPAIG